jgi:hypothetical protein
MSDPEELVLTAEEKANEVNIAACLAEFDLHRKALLGALRTQYERSAQTRLFDEDYAWRHIGFMAGVYLRNEADVGKRQAAIPNKDRISLLNQLEKASGNARRKVDEAMKVVRGPLFMAWCEANGNPDYTDPIIDRYDCWFDEAITDLRAGLATLETVAFKAAETIRQAPGRPAGTTVLPQDFIFSLESVYRDITKRKAGAGPGPFSRFVQDFLAALGRECPAATVIDAIKDAKKHEESSAIALWNRSFFE